MTDLRLNILISHKRTSDSDLENFVISNFYDSLVKCLARSFFSQEKTFEFELWSN